MRINYDFLDLEAFLAVRDTGSFHLASERLHLSQSSVTRRVQKLEEALGTVLFDRTTREVRPTLAAKRLALRAEAILGDARETMLAMRDDSAAFAHQRAQTVTLACLPTLVAGLVAPSLRRFAEAGHRTRVRVLDLAANDVAEAVAQGDADFGIGAIPMLEPTTEFAFLFDDTMVLALPPDHPLAARDRLSWAELGGAALILPARGTGNRLLIDEALARTGTPVAWTYEVGRTATALDLVAQGVGIAPLPRTALHGVPSSRVRGLAVTSPEVARPIGLLTRVGQTPTPAADALRQVIMDGVVQA